MDESDVRVPEALTETLHQFTCEVLQVAYAEIPPRTVLVFVGLESLSAWVSVQVLESVCLEDMHAQLRAPSTWRVADHYSCAPF